MFVSAVTLALNVADPLLAGQYGKAAFDAVGPVLLIGWAEVGPGMIQSISQLSRSLRVEGDVVKPDEHIGGLIGELADLDRARQADARHWAEYRRPISADAARQGRPQSTSSERPSGAVDHLLLSD